MFSSRKSAAPSTGYLLTKSLRFRSSASAYLDRTPASASNRKTWTWSVWVKRGTLGTNQVLFGAYDNSSGTDATYTSIGFTSSNTFSVSGWTVYYRNTTQVFRDPSAWYHVVVALDTTQATASNRVKVYVNGSEVTAFGENNNPSQNADLGINLNQQHGIGRINYLTGSGPYYFDGYMTEINFIDGQALTPSSFGQTSSTTGVWQPIRYTGTYGTNGFYLDFEDTSSVAALGYDAAGSNDWTVNNISLTSGSTYDSMKDVPTLTSPTAANYCTWNPVGIYVTTPLDGNLKISGTSAGANGTIGASSGKFYWECVYTAIGSSEGVIVGIRSTDSIATGAAENVGYYGGGTENGKKIVNGVGSAYAATWTTNDVIGVALDLDGGTVTFYKNNVSQGAISFTVGGKTWTSFNWRTGPAGTNTGTINFGQQPFSYTPPSGFVALNTFNLPTPTIGATASSQANKYMDATLYTGNGSYPRNITGLGFQPDFVWVKARNQAYSHILYDVLRGTGNTTNLSSDSTSAEPSASTNANLTSFNSDGFTVDTTSSTNILNANTITFVAWNWKANGTGVTNTAGSITSTVSANTTAGFSIVTYTGNATSGATVGHGLGVAPSMVIVKSRSAANNWCVYHISMGNQYATLLNTTAGSYSNSNYWNNTSPTSTLFSLGNGNDTNQSSATFVAYCFAQVAGYSAFGSYTGNGSSDGPFVFTGFRPRFIMIKRTDSTANWRILDTARDTYNVEQYELYPNLSNAEGTFSSLDGLSNGFKIRNSDAAYNASGGTYIYMAFAEFPFRYSLAR